MLSDEHAYTVCTCIASPRTDKHKPYGKHSSRKHSCKVNVRQHYRYIKYSEKCRHDLLCIIFRIRKYKHCHLADQIRHKKQHKPCMFFSREIFFHINKRIIPESKNITVNKTCPPAITVVNAMIISIMPLNNRVLNIDYASSTLPNLLCLWLYSSIAFTSSSFVKSGQGTSVK